MVCSSEKQLFQLNIQSNSRVSRPSPVVPTAVNAAEVIDASYIADIGGHV